MIITRYPFLISIAGIATIATLATLRAAEKTTAPATADYPFWTAPKRGSVGPFVPGLNAVLDLTSVQQEQIAAAREEMTNDDAVKAARLIAKSDPNVTAEQRDHARAVDEAAKTRLREKVTAILTPEQKALIEKINTAYSAAVDETGSLYADRFASVKADDAARRRIQEEKNQDLKEQFLHKLNRLLTPGQMEAIRRAAEQEAQRAATKKPAKQ